MGVAFKMLKQLGCQVSTIDPEDQEGANSSNFIEVRQQAQPVLFQMLIEFGYQPFLTVDSAVAIRVEQPRQRAREEVFAALAAPKPPRPPQQVEGQSARPRMSSQEEQDMVRRLTERKAAKAAEAAAAAAQEKEKEARSCRCCQTATFPSAHSFLPLTCICE